MLTLVLLLLTTFLSSSHQQCFSDKDFVGYHTTAEIYTWAKSRINFGVSLMKTLNNQNNVQNLIFSPWSIQEALLLAYFGAKNETESSLAKVLQIPAQQTKPLTLWFYNLEKEAYVDKETPAKNYSMKSANKIFLSNKLTPRRCMKEKFENELQLINFERDSGNWAKNYINSWVESMTEGEIKDFYDDLPPTTDAVLVNAVYYKGAWADKFNPELTRKMTFHRTPVDGTTTEMMVKRGHFSHAYNKILGGRMLLLPYVDNRTAMIVLLPDQDLNTMIESMDAVTMGIVTDIKAYRVDYFEITIPKYKHETGIRIGSALSKLGIGKALTSNADYSGFTGRREIFFEDFLHKAVIKVDEEGTTAAAATGSAPSSAVNPLDFHCDRPFAYMIYDFLKGKMLFMGTFRQP